MKKLTKLAAALLASAMLLAPLAACSDNKGEGNSPSQSAEPTASLTDAPTKSPHDHDHGHDSDPNKIIIGKVGSIEFTMQDFLNEYEAYAPYAAYVSDLNSTIIARLTEAGVLLNRCDELGIELTAEDELLVQKRSEDSFNALLSQMRVDENVTDPEEIRKAQLEELEAMLGEHGHTVESYKQMMTDDMLTSMRIMKLRERTVEDIVIEDAKVEEFFNAQLENDKALYTESNIAFAENYNSYLGGQALPPLYTPEGMFNVKHLLVQFENCMNVPEEEGVFGSKQNAILNEVRAALQGGISLDDFVSRFVSNADYNSDLVLTPPDPEEVLEFGDSSAGFREHGYLVHESITGNYFEGFGEAACILKYGENWMPAPPPDGSEPAQPPIEKYGIVFYETTDGHKIAEVRTNVFNGGIHFIYINEELESGEAKLDLGNENDPIYAAVAAACRQEKEQEHFQSVFEQWKSGMSIEFNDELIAHYISDHYSVG